MSQDEFNQKVIDHLIALGNRLESIERMLGDQEEDCPVIDRKVAMDKLDELLSRPDPILEPEWRPMSTAPSNKSIRVKRFDTGEEFYAYWDKSMSVWACSRVLHPEAIQFMTHEHELSGWRPL